MDSPAVSVLIPAYNMGRYIERALRSALDGRMADVEVIVIDDGSTDRTADLVQPYTVPGSSCYDRRVRYANQDNRGKAAALNRGIDLARGAYLTVLDADDELPVDSLPCRLNAAKADSGESADLVVGGFEVIQEGRVCGRRAAPSTTCAEALRKRFYRSSVTPFHLNSCLMARELVHRVGGFDERRTRCQDIDYALRLLDKAEAVCVVDAPVYRYRKHRSTVRERMRYRFLTMRHRPVVLWKNLRGVECLTAIGYNIGLDMAKLVYELRGSYTR